MLKKLLLHAAPYVRRDWLPCLSTQDIFFSHNPSLPLALSLGSSLNYLNYILTPPPSRSPNASHPGYLPQMLRQIPPLSNNGGTEIRFPLIFICCQSSYFRLLYIQTFKRHESEIVKPAAALSPPSVYYIFFFFFCLSDCSARMRRETDGSDE